MTVTRILMTAFLYASLALAANAAGLTEDEISRLEAMREGDMRKLVLRQGKDLSALGYQDAGGTPVAIGDSNGRIRVLNFWATWCAPCREEKPTLDALQRSLGGPEFQVIAVATGRNPAPALKKFNAEAGITALETTLDPKGELARSLGVFGLPVTLILDRDGTEIARLTGGADWNSQSARAILESLIAAEN